MLRQKGLIVNALKHQIPPTPDIISWTPTKPSLPPTPQDTQSRFRNSSRAEGRSRSPIRTKDASPKLRSRSPGPSSSRGAHSSRSQEKSPKPIPSCSICGGRGHYDSECSNIKIINLDFCPRCLDQSHKMKSCPHINHQCQTCRENGLDEYFSSGHLRIIHREQNPERRQRIMDHFPAICFSSWSKSVKESKRN